MYCFNAWDTINYDFAIDFWWGFSNLIKYFFIGVFLNAINTKYYFIVRL